MFNSLYPNYRADSTYDIDFETLFERGIRGLLFDIDNTLVTHGDPADERAMALFKRLQDIGFQYCFLSNNKEPRVKSFSEKVGGFYIFKAGKPSVKGYLEGMEKMQTNRENTVFVGDQLLTDIWGANRAGVTSYLVKPIDKREEIQIVLKRYLERFIMWTWKISGK